MQLVQIQEEKKIWSARQDSLKEQDKQVSEKLKNIANQDNEWKNKKRGYEGEISRWNKEIDKQQKTYDNFKNMAEVKE